jgi:L-asparaginase/Glu-tRNA(Gln) amidotransferase subunit D
MESRILLIRTGGTIDAEPYADPESPPHYVATLSAAASLVFPTVQKLPNHDRVDGFTWAAQQEGQFVKDSQLFTAEDVKELASIIKQDNHHDRFILTHGTDAMVKNATLLQQELQGSDKAVVIVGSMVPLSMHDKFGSDAIFFLSYALRHIDECPQGVSLVGTDSETEHLKFFDPSQVQKDRKASLENLIFTLAPA